VESTGKRIRKGRAFTLGPAKNAPAGNAADETGSPMDRKIRKRWWSPGRIAWLVSALALLALVLWSLSPLRGGKTLRVPKERIMISTVSRGEFQEFIPVTGTVIPVTTHYLDATEGGRVEEVFREAGSFVDRGDEILRLANTNLLLDIMYREAELYQQSNNLRNTKILMEQNRLQMRREILEIDHDISRQRRITESYTELAKDNLVSRQDYDEARDRLAYLTERRELVLAAQQQDELFREAQIRQLEASLQRIQTNLEIVKRNMENLVIRAPVAGQLTALNAEIGQSKARGERMGQIDVLDGFKLRAAVDEFYITRIVPELKGTFEFSGETFEVSIDKIYPQVVQGRFEVDLRFDGEEPSGIRRGQTIRLRLALGDPSEALLLPAGSFQQTSGGRWAYLVDASGETATKREIRLGRQSPQYFEVLGGLEPGDRVITSNYEFFGDAERLILTD
jgi:HlyD family secretion protein